jgi:hypothetical protein
MENSGARSFGLRLGPNQSLTLNTTIHGKSMMRTLDMITDWCSGGTGGQGGESHGQAPGGQGGHGEAPTVNYNFSLYVRALPIGVICDIH